MSSLKSLRTALVAAGIAGASLAGASAANAAVQTAAVPYACQFPLASSPTQVLVNFTETVPDGMFHTSAAIAAITYTASFTGGANVASVFGALGVTSIAGKAGSAAFSVSNPPQTVSITGPLTTDKVTLGDDVTFAASGSIPPLTFKNAGNVSYAIGTLDFNVEAFRSDGTPVHVDPRPGTTDSDVDSKTFDIFCTRSATSDGIVLSGPVTDPTSTDHTAPSAPTGVTYTGTAFTPGAGLRSTITWTAATDDIGVVAYDVYDTSTGSPVLLTRVPGTATSASFTPTKLNYDYAIVVKARDAAGNSSAASAPPISFYTCGTLPDGVNQPTGVTATNVSGTAATISWTAPVADRCHVSAKNYTVKETAPTAATLGTTSGATSLAIDHLQPNTTYSVVVSGGGLDSAPVTFTTGALTTPDTTPPSKPGTPTVAWNGGSEPPTISWGASTDDIGVTAYDVYDGSTLVTSVDGATLSTVLPFATNTIHVFTVKARDAAGNTSAASDPVENDECTPAPSPVDQPTSPAVSAVSDSAATISWSYAHVACGVKPSSIDIVETSPSNVVLKSVTETGGAPTTSVALSALTPGTTYTVRVKANLGGASKVTSDVTFTTQPGVTPPLDVARDYAVAGSATLKSLVKGTLPLTGTLNGSEKVATGEYSGTLTLGETTAKLTALGFIPVTAKLDLVPTTPLTGTFGASSFVGSVKARIKLPSLTVFGVQLGGGTNCQASQLSTIALANVGAFSATAGGTIAGTFSISNLTGCGALNGLVSPLTAGSGNAISLKLTPPAKATPVTTT